MSAGLRALAKTLINIRNEAMVLWRAVPIIYQRCVPMLADLVQGAKDDPSTLIASRDAAPSAVTAGLRERLLKIVRVMEAHGGFTADERASIREAAAALEGEGPPHKEEEENAGLLGSAGKGKSQGPSSTSGGQRP